MDSPSGTGGVEHHHPRPPHQGILCERDALIAYNAKMFTIASDEKLDVWHQLEILMTRWCDVERLSEERRPFIYALYRTRATRLV